MVLYSQYMPYMRIFIPVEGVQLDRELGRIVNRLDGSKQPARDIKALVGKYRVPVLDVRSSS